MAIQVVGYRYMYHVNGCTRRVVLSRRGMERHEETCLANPANRTCKTCRHDANELVDYGVPEQNPWREFYCSSEDRDGRPEGVPIVRDCPQWQVKENAATLISAAA